ncbi:MAG TPA: hypothetical protein PK400_13475 [Phycisphaerales bacterium]|nr:hypothetical protein [Phycisphaerales bacterium]HRQ75937.1 hypothetical protein [Phycisphaerales bacterium]
MNTESDRIRVALRWALETSANASVAAADWIAQDIDPTQPSAIALLTRPDVPLQHLAQAKQAYKTMRILGESAADRRVGGVMYLAAIAAAIVLHGVRISRQSDRALLRGLRRLREDSSIPSPLADLARRAVEVLQATPSKLKEI